MERVDFTEYTWLSDCPRWWQNFIEYYTDEEGVADQAGIKTGLDKFGAKFIDGIKKNLDGSEYDGIRFIEFETKEDMNSFKLFWALYG